jgi:hypothetical protein
MPRSSRLVLGSSPLARRKPLASWTALRLLVAFGILMAVTTGAGADPALQSRLVVFEGFYNPG